MVAAVGSNQIATTARRVFRRLTAHGDNVNAVRVISRRNTVIRPRNDDIN